MYLEQLRFFHAVAEKESFTGAAAELHLTQPAVSNQVRNLEENVGQRLFERYGRQVKLTRAGEVLYTYTKRIFQQVHEAESILRDLRSLQTGNLVLGTVDVMSIYVLPSIFRDFHEAHPRVEISIEVGDSANIARGVADGRYDLGFITLPLENHSLLSIPIYNDVMRVIAPAGHPLAAKGRVTLEDLSRTTLIIYKRGSVTRRLIEQKFQEAGVAFEPDMEIDRPEAMKRLVEAGLGVSIMPAMSVVKEVEEGTLVVLDTGDVHFERSLGLIYRRGQIFSPSTQAFLAVIREKLKPALWIEEVEEEQVQKES